MKFSKEYYSSSPVKTKFFDKKTVIYTSFELNVITKLYSDLRGHR